jgi:hypothetical protein
LGTFPRIEVLLGVGHVAGGVDELLELRVGHFGDVHPEALDRDGMRRGFLRVLLVGLVRAHREFAAGNPDHARIGRGRDGGGFAEGQDDEGSRHQDGGDEDDPALRVGGFLLAGAGFHGEVVF